VIQPSPAQLAVLVTGAMGAGAVLAETVPAYDIVVDRGMGTVYTYSGCKVNSLEISGTPGGIVVATLDIVGLTDAASGTVSAETIAAPYVFSDATITLATVARLCKRFSIRIDNQLEPRFVNQLAANEVNERDRIVTLGVTCAYNSDFAALYAAGLAGVAGTLVLNDGATSKTFTFIKLQFPARADPEVSGKNSEIERVLEMQAVKSSTTAELTYA
jgi:hypothetical protein